MTVARLSAATAPELPPYDRTARPSIVHLGVGAFARAHLGAYADDLCRLGHPALIRGVSLRSRRAEEQLAPQDGLHALVEREPGGDAPLRLLGGFTSVTTGREAAVEAIADPATTLLTLTVTEKGYAPDEVPTVVVDGLARRDRSRPLVVASLDNLVDNGALLRTRVLEVADRRGPGLADWIAGAVAFPSSVVDRMVPATTATDLDEVGARLGVRDEGAVVAERHCSWAIEAVDGLPPLAEVGVQVVDDLGPFQRRKLWLLNGPHSALAYGGLLAGCATIAEAAAAERVAPFVAALVDDVLAVADGPGGRSFADEALSRFANPALGHTCRQVGADGSQKLPQRILSVVAAREAAGLPTIRFAVVVAAWLAALADGMVEDPAGPNLAGATSEAFAAEVATAGRRLARDGVDVLGDLT